MTVETQVLWGLGVFAGLLLLIMLRKLLVKAVRLLLRTAAGAGVLALLAQTSGALGIQLGSICTTLWCWACWVRQDLACC